MIEKLIAVVNEKDLLQKTLKEKKEEFENENLLLIANIKDLEIKEILLREDMINVMKNSNISKMETDGVIINLQTRTTKSVEDNFIFMESVMSVKGEMSKLGVKYSVTDFIEDQLVITDKKKALEIAEKYYKINGKELDGIGVKNTEFLVLKNKKNN